MHPDDDLPVETEAVPPGENLMCHRDFARVCGPDCIAFLVKPPEGNEYIGQSWARCLELVDQHRQAKHVNIIAVQLIQLNTRAAAKEADARRQLPVMPTLQGMPR